MLLYFVHGLQMMEALGAIAAEPGEVPDCNCSCLFYFGFIFFTHIHTSPTHHKRMCAHKAQFAERNYVLLSKVYDIK